MENKQIIAGVYADNGSNVNIDKTSIVVGDNNDINLSDADLRSSIEKLINAFDAYKQSSSQDVEEVNAEVERLRVQLKKPSLNKCIVKDATSLIKDFFVAVVANQYTPQIVAIASTISNAM